MQVHSFHRFLSSCLLIFSEPTFLPERKRKNKSQTILLLAATKKATSKFRKEHPKNAKNKVSKNINS